MKKGHLYLVMEKKPQMSYGCFTGLLKKGVTGLCISRQHPKSIRVNYSMEYTHILWLTTAMGDNYVNPTNIGILTNFTVNFMHSNVDNSVVLIDGIEYLTVYNDFNSVLKSVYYINEVAMKSRAIVIIPVAPQAFEDKNLALLEREAKVSRPNQ
jgi:archaellum biogenesis ATPase FlaH